MILIQCENVKKYFPVKSGYLEGGRGEIRAVDSVSLTIRRSETFGLVGESGSGKTTLGKIILGIVKPDSGVVLRRARRMHVVFQDPYNSLDPHMDVFKILSEGPLIKGEPKDRVRQKVEEVLGLVKLPREALRKYPHQFSGGERQRIAIGRAVLTEPDFIVCDEPVSSLDVTIQLQILKLLKEIQKRLGITYLFISHDLRVVKFMCDRVAVMKEGRIVEEAPPRELYEHPVHPYTRSLISSVPEAGLRQRI